MKKLALLALLTACKLPTKDVNKAVVMVQAQAPSAVCTDFPTRDDVSIAVCTLVDAHDKSKSATYVSVYSANRPWQVFPLKDVADPPAPPPASASAPPPAPAPTPGSGSGSGSAAHSK